MAGSAKSNTKASGNGSGVKVVATNRQARRDYEIIDTLECGMVLRGSEVKSLREAKVQLKDSYARFEGHELYVVGLHINQYSHATYDAPQAERTRKLLARRDELDRLESRVDQDRLSVVPLSLYFKNGRAKLEVGLGRGRKHYDKRNAIAERDANREAQRAMARTQRGRGDADS